MAGIRVYFGNHDKTLIRRQREDDPVVVAPHGTARMAQRQAVRQAQRQAQLQAQRQAQLQGALGEHLYPLGEHFGFGRLTEYWLSQ